MVKTQKNKYILLQAAIVALTASCCVFPDAMFIVAAITVQIGIYSALAAQKPYVLSLVSVPASYGVAFALVGDWRIALLSVIFYPVGTLIAFCIRKGFTRTRTVLLSSVCFGTLLVGYVALVLYMWGITSFDGFATALTDGMAYLAEMSADNLPEVSLVEGLTRDAYRDLLYDFMRIASIGAFALMCNTVAFASTALTKRIVFSTKGNALLNNDQQWLYVLSKPSAVMFIVCYLCVLVGGETLTLPQQVAFNTVIVATFGGVLVMSLRAVKGKTGFAGIPKLLIYAIIFFIFGLQAVLILLSVTGLIAAFRYKNKEDKGVCRK